MEETKLTKFLTLLGRLSFDKTESPPPPSPPPLSPEIASEAISEPPPLRLLIFRSLDSKTKILFDSDYVTDEGLYTIQKDKKYVKEVLSEFVFGSVGLRDSDTIRFTRIGETNAFAVVWRSSTTSVMTPPMEMSSSSSSSGYSSLPLLTPYRSLVSSHSLPTTPVHSCVKQHTFALLLLFTKPPPIAVEPLLPKLKCFVMSNLKKKKFPENLKAYSNSLTIDLNNYNRLSRVEFEGPPEVVNLLSFKLLSEFLSHFLINPQSKLVICGHTRLAEDILKLLTLLKQFVCVNTQPDSGVFSTNSSYHNSNSFTTPYPSTSSEYDSSEEEPPPPPQKFYLGDNSDDEQTESRLTLSEPDKNKLFPHHFPVKHIEIQLPTVTEPPLTSCYFKNNTTRFSPLPMYQLTNNQLSYDHTHTITEQIIDLNLQTNKLKLINTQPPPLSKREQTQSVVAKTLQLTKLITDNEKTLYYLIANLNK